MRALTATPTPSSSAATSQRAVGCCQPPRAAHLLSRHVARRHAAAAGDDACPRRQRSVIAAAAARKAASGATKQKQAAKSGKGFGPAKPEKAAPAEGCPCGSLKFYKECCKPYHTGGMPPSVEATVRARFSAMLKKDVSFLLRTSSSHFTSTFAPDEADSKEAMRKLQDAYWNSCDHYEYSNLRVRGVEPSERHPTDEQAATFSYTLYDQRTPLIDEAGNKARKVVTERSTFVRNEEGLWQFNDYQIAEMPEAFARLAEQEARELAAKQQAAAAGDSSSEAAATGA